MRVGLRHIRLHWPTSSTGSVVALTAMAFGLGTRVWLRDEVANAIALLLGVILAGELLLLFLSRLSLRGPVFRRILPEPGWIEADPGGAAETAPWALEPSPWWNRLGLCWLELTWSAGGPLLLAPPRLRPDGRIEVNLARRGEYAIQRRLTLRDCLALVRASILLPMELPLIALPRRSPGVMNLLRTLAPAGDRWVPSGRPDGDWFAIKPAEPQTPRRLLLWKLTEKSGSPQRMRRAPETVGSTEFRTGLFLCLSPEDEPAASVLRSIFESHWADEELLGVEWCYADSCEPGTLTSKSGSSRREALTRLARSGHPGTAPWDPAEGLRRFLAGTAGWRLNRLLIFHGGPTVADWQRGFSPPRGIEVRWLHVESGVSNQLSETVRRGETVWLHLTIARQFPAPGGPPS